MAPPVRERRARAKVNLCLHVVGQRADGYHVLESLVVFPDIGDVIGVEPATTLGVTLGGPFAADLDAGGDNLVLQAAMALDRWARDRGDLRPRGAALSLRKNLPVASGVGGGSTDAAAALLALSEHWGLAPSPDELHAIGLGLGADVPVCLADRASWMGGIGEDVSPAPPPPPFSLVLVNPGVAVSTPAVFKALIRKNNPPPSRPKSFGDLDAFVAWLAGARNDLEPPAASVRPEIKAVLTALSSDPRCRLARMSGSGATCFGLFASIDEAQAAAERLRAAHPSWWIAAAPTTPSA